MLSGCAIVGPDYAPPDPALPTAYDAPIPAIFAGDAPPAQWWAAFDDPVLDELIARGVTDNLEIRAAASRIREARALARAIEGLTGPQLDFGTSAGADWQRRFAGSDGRAGGRSDGWAGFASGSAEGIWEIDLFGRIFRTRQAAWAQARQVEALGREAARLTAAEIARLYVERRASLHRLALIEESLDLQRQTLELVQRRVQTGLAPGLDHVRARGEVAALAAELGPLRAQIAQIANALALLLGETPGALEPLLTDSTTIPTAGTGRAVGAPANLLRRRPDVQAAELAIVAATAEVGIETAELYPRLAVPGTISLGVSDIGAGAVAQLVASLSAALDVPLFDGGQRRAEVTAAEERVIQAVLAYRLTILQAIAEVERALQEYAGAHQRVEALEDAVVNNRAAFEQSRILYQRGFASFLDVLDSQRALNSSQQQLALSQRDLALRTIDLYTALGTSLDYPGDGADPI